MAVQNSATFSGRNGSDYHKHQNKPHYPAHGERLLGGVLDRAAVYNAAEAE